MIEITKYDFDDFIANEAELSQRFTTMAAGRLASSPKRVQMGKRLINSLKHCTTDEQLLAITQFAEKMAYLRIISGSTEEVPENEIAQKALAILEKIK